jgi:hypothetical protein
VANEYKATRDSVVRDGAREDLGAIKVLTKVGESSERGHESTLLLLSGVRNVVAGERAWAGPELAESTLRRLAARYGPDVVITLSVGPIGGFLSLSRHDLLGGSRDGSDYPSDTGEEKDAKDVCGVSVWLE